jgi:N-acetylglutamate synthase-like GNAT family acetyltransferase
MSYRYSATSYDPIRTHFPRLTLTEAEPTDVPEIRAFILAADSPNLVIHPEGVQRNAAFNGLLFKVENAGDLVATGQLIPVKNTDCFEMGGCYVSEPYRGLGIQKSLIVARAAALIAISGRKAVLVTAVNPEKSPESLHNVTEAGFRILDPYPKELLQPCSGCLKRKTLPPGRLCCCRFFFLPPERHRCLVANFLRMDEEALLPSRNGVPFVLRNSSRNAINPDQRRVLEDFVGGRA